MRYGIYIYIYVIRRLKVKRVMKGHACVISGSRLGIDEISLFEGGGVLLTLRSGQLVGPVLTRNVGKYQSTPRNVPEERRSRGVCLSHTMLNGVVGIVPRLRAGQSCVRIPAETKDFYLLQTVQTYPGVHRCSYLIL